MIGKLLQNLLDEKGMNVNELSKIIDVSNQTLYSIIKRDNMKIDFEILLKICKALNVSVEYFYNDYVQTAPIEDLHITDHEKALIRAYRSQPAMQEAVDKLLGVPAASDLDNIIDDAVNTVNAISSAVSRQECKK